MCVCTDWLALLFYLHLHFSAGVVSIRAGAAPAEGGLPASAAGQATCTEEGTAENQAADHTRAGGHRPLASTLHHPGKYSWFLLPSKRGHIVSRCPRIIYEHKLLERDHFRVTSAGLNYHHLISTLLISPSYYPFIPKLHFLFHLIFFIWHFPPVFFFCTFSFSNPPSDMFIEFLVFYFPISDLILPVRRQWGSPRGMGPVPLLLLLLFLFLVFRTLLTLPDRRWFLSCLCFTWPFA